MYDPAAGVLFDFQANSSGSDYRRSRGSSSSGMSRAVEESDSKVDVTENLNHEATTTLDIAWAVATVVTMHSVTTRIASSERKCRLKGGACMLFR